MTEEYKQIYNQQDELIKESFRLLNIYVNGYKMLQDSGPATEQNKNLFRLAYCCLFNLLENAVIRREIIRATDNTYNIEGQYSNRRMLVSIYEMNKNLFGVNEKTEKKSLWNATKQTLELFDAKVYGEIDKPQIRNYHPIHD